MQVLLDLSLLLAAGARCQMAPAVCTSCGMLVLQAAAAEQQLCSTRLQLGSQT
jgi:hypothetical protein